MSDAPIARVSCAVNGRHFVLEGHPITRLLDALRRAGLTSVKEGCGEGECGACAILLDGQLVNSCLTPLSHAEGRAITTVEGIPSDGLLQAIQTSFVECGGAQCGICTPGMVLAAHELLSRMPNPSEDEVRAALAGNLCRCTGYQRILAAVLDAAQKSPRIARA